MTYEGFKNRCFHGNDEKAIEHLIKEEQTKEYTLTGNEKNWREVTDDCPEYQKRKKEASPSKKPRTIILIFSTLAAALIVYACVVGIENLSPILICLLGYAIGFLLVLIIIIIFGKKPLKNSECKREWSVTREDLLDKIQPYIDSGVVKEVLYMNDSFVVLNFSDVYYTVSPYSYSDAGYPFGILANRELVEYFIKDKTNYLNFMKRFLCTPERHKDCVHYLPQSIPVYKKNMENYDGKRFVDEDFNQILREQYKNSVYFSKRNDTVRK